MLTAYCLLLTAFSITAPTAFKINLRGTTRSASTAIKFVQPEITELLRRFRARSAVSTTSSGVCEVRAGGRCMREASKKFVSVTPGHNAITSIPYGRFSSHKLSENDSTKAFVAAYVAMKGTA